MKIASNSVKGNYRSKNDDRVGIFQNNHKVTLALLCDGIGGYDGGDIAANVVISEFGLKFQKEFNFIEFNQIENWIDQTVSYCKNQIKKIALSNKIKPNMGTTLSGIIILENQKKALLFNSGDSRIYLVLKNKQLIQATKDHNVENKLIQEGTPIEIAKKNPLASYLTSAVGLNIKTIIEFEEIESDIYQKINKFLLTSDGIHGFLYADEINSIVIKNIEPEKIIEKLIEQAIFAESTDNMSAIVIDLESENE
ncbi:PP2C family protein-serine/threonine phosphatase [Mycoplasmopsis cricetuli]|uniref:PP2C family protein-serine/threonine phosphatase n=1 Tax=Mycoplasmopsis cricetuli TaxID=171283 RepID=UPI00068890C1|nr:PP2C family serine/threonine-protein phosphatase [Mycoplasmopsis cricetuli]